MYRLLPLVASLAATDIEAAIRKRKRNAALYGLAALLALTAWFTGIAGVAIVLADRAGAAEAVFAIAAALVVTALAVWIAIHLLNRADRRRQAQSTSPALLGAAAVAIAPMILRSRILPLLALAAGAAYVTGRIRSPGGAGDE